MAIAHPLLISIAKRLIRPGQFVFKVYGRELKILKGLTAKYDDVDFWFTFNIGFKPDSLRYFNCAEGKVELERAWRLYQLEAAQKKALDKPVTSPSVEETVELQEHKEKQNVFQWTDSK